jgi:hypothetical protein
VSISSVEVAAETSITKTVHDGKIDPNFAFIAAVRVSSVLNGSPILSKLLSEMKRSSPKSRAASVTYLQQPVRIDEPSSLRQPDILY